ncbi:MAG TPA: hypothetical protein PKJ77_06560, partial [Thermodesulfobacteriota bacterium]|nr:hypothetical protein [Thermodesulfobacteriota bacterium]
YNIPLLLQPGDVGMSGYTQTHFPLAGEAKNLLIGKQMTVMNKKSHALELAKKIWRLDGHIDGKLIYLGVTVAATTKKRRRRSIQCLSQSGRIISRRQRVAHSMVENVTGMNDEIHPLKCPGNDPLPA